MFYNSSRALELLRLGSGLKDATFRQSQEEAIRHIVEGRGRLLVVQRTGWDKSFVYFIATQLLREQGHGQLTRRYRARFCSVQGRSKLSELLPRNPLEQSGGFP